MSDRWDAGEAYEPYVGRWSRLVAERFVDRLEAPAGGAWLDVGCGTGALTRTILERTEPASVHGVDPSEAFISYARAHIRDPHATFEVGDAQDLPGEDAAFDHSVSGLVLNFVPDPARAAAEMRRVTKPGGRVAAYVWDYAEGMQMMRHFWDAAAEIDPEAAALDEGARFPVARPDALDRLWTEAGLRDVEVVPIEVDTIFRDADDLWMPFLGGQGPAPSYVMSLPEDLRAALRAALLSRVTAAPDGSIPLRARAWAVLGTA